MPSDDHGLSYVSRAQLVTNARSFRVRTLRGIDWRIFMPVPNPEIPFGDLAMERVWMYWRGVQLARDDATMAQSSMYKGRSAALTFRTAVLLDPVPMPMSGRAVWLIRKTNGLT